MMKNLNMLALHDKDLICYLFVLSFFLYCAITYAEMLVMCDEPCRILSFFNLSQR
jgi:hypothetical protein